MRLNPISVKFIALLANLYIIGSISIEKFDPIVSNSVVYPISTPSTSLTTQEPITGSLTGLPSSSASSVLGGVMPPNTLSHFAIITSWEGFNTTLSNYGKFLGVTPPSPNEIAGGPDSNGTYIVDGVAQRLVGTTKIAFLHLNNYTQMEFLAGDPSAPSWWRDVYLLKGFEVHHMGYRLPANVSIWSIVEAFTAALLGPPVQWGRWGVEDTNSGGCYVYMDSQSTLGVTTEILGSDSGCDSLPAQP